MLELINVNAYYGRIQALKDVSLRVDEGKIVSLLGANGAGKTTTVRTIVGLNRSTANDIRFEGRPIGRIPPHQIVRLGIAMAATTLIFGGGRLRQALQRCSEQVRRPYLWWPFLLMQPVAFSAFAGVTHLFLEENATAPNYASAWFIAWLVLGLLTLVLCGLA